MLELEGPRYAALWGKRRMHCLGAGHETRLAWTTILMLLPLTGCGDSGERTARHLTTDEITHLQEQFRVTPTPDVPRVSVPIPVREWTAQDTAMDALARIGRDAVPALVEALGDRNVQVRRQAALALGRIGPDAEQAVPALSAALGDGDEQVRRNAARALGQIGPAAKEAIGPLMQLLRQPPVPAAGQP